MSDGGTLHALYLRTTSQLDALLSILLAEGVPWCGLLYNLALAAPSAQAHRLGLEPACELTVSQGYRQVCSFYPLLPWHLPGNLFSGYTETESEPSMALVTLQSAFQASPESTPLSVG